MNCERRSHFPKCILALALVLWAAGPRHPSEAMAGSATKGFSDSDYALVLSKYVNSRGKVNYRALKANRGPLDRYLASAARPDRRSYDGWSDKAKIAFWINAYNAWTLQVILDNYPIKASFWASRFYPKNSIRQIAGVWDKLTFRAMGKAMTLNDVEHNVLRKQFDEPRIHWGLVCASVGCPNLRAEPYTAERFDEQCREQIEQSLRDPTKFRVDRGRKRVYLSAILKWFAEDFVSSYGTDAKFGDQNREVRAVLNFISRYLSRSDQPYLAAGGYKVAYLKYDWSLNER